MLKKRPLFFLAVLVLASLVLISVKISSDSFKASQDLEPNTLELAGLKIKTPKLEQPLEPTPAPITGTATNLNLKKIPTCLPLGNLKSYKTNFIQKNKADLTKILGFWYFDKSKNIDFDYDIFDNLSPAAVYSLALQISQQTTDFSDKKNSKRYDSTNIFYRIYYKDRSNSDALFYIYNLYKKMKLKDRALSYLKGYLKESSIHKDLYLELNSEIIKLSTDPESLLGAYSVLSEFQGLSSGVYLLILSAIEKEGRIKIAKNMIKSGADKNSVNAHLDWSPETYKAAYKVLNENDLARSHLPYAELKESKSESNDAFMNKLAAAETTCDLEEAWSIASAVIREL